MPKPFSRKPLGEIANLTMGQSPDSQFVHEGSDYGVPFLQGNGEFGDRHPEPLFSCSNPPRTCRKDDVLISVRAPVGEINLADTDYCIGRGLAAIRFGDIPALLGQKLVGKFAPALKAVAQGTTFEAIGKRELASLELLVPPAEEQNLIGQILDTLDTQIRQTEAVIAKLERIKQGLLTDLLTRGIDENGELRPSLDEAPHIYKDSPLGIIPREWNVVTIESLSEMVTSGARDWARYYSEYGAKFIRIGNLTRDHINFRFDSLVYVRPPSQGEAQRTRLEVNDVLISITADLGISAVVHGGIGEAYINQHIALVRPCQDIINPRFLGHYISSRACQKYISALNDAGAKAGLNLPTVRNILVARPKRQEQDAIRERLDAIDNCIQMAKHEASKLKLEKSGLMDDLLTGRVRVTPLLEEAEYTHA